MACTGPRENDVQKKFSPPSPHFFKIIFIDTLRDNKLQIPNRIVNKCGGTLSIPVLLKLPCGLKWKYEGNSQFHVLIFDKSTTEIDYPSNPNWIVKHNIGRSQPQEVKEEEDDDSVEILESFSPFPKRREKSQLTCSWPRKRMKTGPDHDETQRGSSHPRSKGKFRMQILEANTSQEVTMRPSSSGDIRASEAANKFFSTNPYFQVSLQSSHFKPTNSRVRVPTAFARTYYEERTQNCESSKDSETIYDKLWKDNIRSSNYYDTEWCKMAYGIGDIWLCKGWPEFVQHFSLENGQALFFKYKGCSQFDVVIIGVTGLEIDYSITNSTQVIESDIDDGDNDDDDGDGGSPCLKEEEEPTTPFPQHARTKSTHDGEPSVLGRKQRSLTMAEKAKALSRTEDFMSQSPYFKAVVRTDFWMECLFDITDDATLYVSHERVWIVKLNARKIAMRSIRVSFLRKGWKDFAVDNDLKVDDVCIFELVNQRKMIFKVTISRDGDFQNSQQSHAGKSAVNQDHPKKSLSARDKTPSTSYKAETCNMRPSMNHVRRKDPNAIAKRKSMLNYAKEIKRQPRSNMCSRLIPTKFVKKYGETLSNSVFVKLPSGSEWKMELRKSNGRFCLQKGWPEFVKYYSIGFGHFLVFRYEGNSRFHACIFDTTTVEIEYPLIRAHSDGPKIEEIKDDGSVEVLEDLSPYPRKRKSSPLPCSQPHKKFRTSPIGETEIKGTRSNERILKNSMRNGDLHHSKSMRGMRKFFLLSFKKLIFWYLNKLLFPCRVVFLYCLFSFILFPVSAEDGNGDKSIMPRWRLSEVKSFTYKVVIKPSHVGKYFDMCLPRKFADGFLKNKCLDAVLKLSDGGTWPIRFRSRRCDDERRRGARFEKPSWEKFARDNNLKVADTCVFELINGNEMSFKVSILKADLDSHPSHGKFWQGQVTRVLKFSGDSRATDAASRFSSKNPFFKKLITSSYLHTQDQQITLKFKLSCCVQRLPNYFGRSYFGKKTQNITLQTGKNSWSVTIVYNAPHSYLFSRGWPTFARENSLRPEHALLRPTLRKGRLGKARVGQPEWAAVDVGVGSVVEC
ncbi:B3 domain-containing transcription factor VRN1 [Morus notabilis]|uniref:B3 domain-containing transcription factor VRN1 n=1 Tax=Morus notabilis TaxID=981085 RepID=W9QPD0_9ROSA|nr:B3 domain-containing transcription factor VRN1 [Morus notabilis]